MPRPLFLALDGLDGSGKSTQFQLLLAALRAMSIPVTAAIDPGGTELGVKLREILLFGREHAISARAEALLFMASRAQLVEEVIRPALARGEVVVSDRYLLANVVYQGHAGGLDPAELWAVGYFASAGFVPDLSLVFDLPLELAAARRGRTPDRIESRGLDYHAAVKAGFLAEAAARPGAVVVIDATPGAEVVAKRVAAIVRAKLRSHGWPVALAPE